MTKLDKDQVIADFTAAYKAKFGKEPELEQKPGWFSVDGDKNIRLAELAELAQSYGKSGKMKVATKKTETASKTDKPAKAEKPAKAAKAVKKPAKAAAKPAAKSKAKAAKPAKTTPGAAAAFWADKVNDSKQRPPRGSR